MKYVAFIVAVLIITILAVLKYSAIVNIPFAFIVVFGVFMMFQLSGAFIELAVIVLAVLLILFVIALGLCLAPITLPIIIYSALKKGMK